MSRMRMLSVVGVAALALVTLGCPKKKSEPPAPPPPPAPVVQTPVPVTPPPAPPVADETPSFLDQELEAMTMDAYQRGLLGDVYFDYDKYDLRPEARQRLAQNAEFMRQYPSLRFTIEGHCDERGTNEYNLALGDRRASTAQGYLSSLGIEGSRFRTVSYGEERPVCTDASESCWQRNRRARFVITGK